MFQRPLNACTVWYQYPVPMLEQELSKMATFKVFAALRVVTLILPANARQKLTIVKIPSSRPMVYFNDKGVTQNDKRGCTFAIQYGGDYTSKVGFKYAQLARWRAIVQKYNTRTAGRSWTSSRHVKRTQYKTTSTKVYCIFDINSVLSSPLIQENNPVRATNIERNAIHGAASPVCGWRFHVDSRRLNGLICMEPSTTACG